MIQYQGMNSNSGRSVDVDPWAMLFRQGTAHIPAAAVGVQSIDGIVPLDRQFGKWPKKTAPAAVEEVLFGPDAHHTLTYVVLDAAIIQNLPEQLEASGLAHACLYQGRALENWGHVAPWLVQIGPSDDFTRILFTRGSDAGLWDADAALYFRSALDFDAMRNLLRKLGRIKDATRGWVQFRYWAAPYLSRYVQGHDPAATGYVQAFMQIATIITPEPARERIVVCKSLSPVADGAPSGIAADRWPGLADDMARIRYDLFIEQLERRMSQELPAVAEIPEGRRLSGLRRMADQARALGLADEGAVERYCIATMLLGHAPERDPRCHSILGSRLHAADKAKLILDLALARN